MKMHYVVLAFQYVWCNFIMYDMLLKTLLPVTYVEQLLIFDCKYVNMSLYLDFATWANMRDQNFRQKVHVPKRYMLNSATTAINYYLLLILHSEYKAQDYQYYKAKTFDKRR